ncbi:MAG: prolipoprotein diacylglyceryl transferase family protein, partial [Anderseniella sp.]
FFTGNAYGTPTDVPWGVELWNAMRHPVQLYDAIALLIVLVVLWYLHKKVLDGELFWRFLMLYSLSRLFLDMFHSNASVWGPGIRINQIISLATLLLSLFILSLFAQQREQVNREQMNDQPDDRNLLYVSKSTL